MLQYQGIGELQLMQCEFFFQRDSSNGTRKITTLRKEPIQAPKQKAKTVNKIIILFFIKLNYQDYRIKIILQP